MVTGAYFWVTSKDTVSDAHALELSMTFQVFPWHPIFLPDRFDGSSNCSGESCSRVDPEGLKVPRLNVEAKYRGFSPLNYCMEDLPSVPCHSSSDRGDRPT